MNKAKARVLIVEDEAIVAKDMAMTLKALHFHVTGIVASGEDALHKAKVGHPDIVLMDIVLEGRLDGIEAGRRIQSSLGIPVVFLTAHADEGTIARAKQAAAYGYLIKPFSERELEVALDTALYRAQLEQRLTDQRHWFESVLNCIGDAVIATDVNSNVIFMNPVAEFLTGRSRDTAFGRPLTEIFHTVDEHSRTPVAPSETRALQDDTQIAEEPEDILLVSADHKERPIISSVAPINDAKGTLLGIVVVFRDVSARRQMERRTLNRQKMEALGKLSSNVAHDFNNIVSLIAGHAATMQEYLLPNSRAFEDTRRIMSVVQHAASLTKRILGVARASDAERNLDIHPVALQDLINQATGLMKESLESRNVTLKGPQGRHDARVSVDTNHFVDLLVDLLLNAAEAMPSGGTISLDLRPFRLLKHDPKANPGAKPGNYVSLRIQDTGTGMSHQVMERIFEPFFTTKSGETHVGLGLPVVHSAIQRYGGWIKASSEPGRGSVFSLTLPVVPAPRRPAAPPQPLASGSVLVADDDDATRAEFREALQAAGFEVHLAGDGHQAIALFRRHADTLTLAIIDVLMPGCGGQEVLQAMFTTNPTMTVIMTSGFSRDHVRSRLPSGNWRFLQKPAEKEQLLGAVRRALEQKTS
jgi:PAS domain S-box-containing protein